MLLIHKLKGIVDYSLMTPGHCNVSFENDTVYKLVHIGYNGYYSLITASLLLYNNVLDGNTSYFI